MNFIKVEAKGEAFIIRKREYFQIPEKVWREKMPSTGGLNIELATMYSPMIERKKLAIKVTNNRPRLVGITYLWMKDVWFWSDSLTDEGTIYNQDEFLKNHLENGFVSGCQT